MTAAPVAAAACRAFNSAFSRKLAPVSSGASTPSAVWLTTSNGSSASSARNSRSLPGFAVATTSSSAARGRSGRADALAPAGAELCGMEARDAGARKVEQLIELVAAKRVAFGGALNLDETAAAVHDDIHVGFGVRVLGIVQINERRSPVDADGDRGHLPVQRVRAKHAPLDQHIDRVGERHEAARDRCGARAAVGLQDIAIDRHGTFAQALEIDDRAQGPADQTLYLLGAAGLLAARR